MEFSLTQRNFPRGAFLHLTRFNLMIILSPILLKFPFFGSGLFPGTRRSAHKNYFSTTFSLTVPVGSGRHRRGSVTHRANCNRTFSCCSSPLWGKGWTWSSRARQSLRSRCSGTSASCSSAARLRVTCTFRAASSHGN